MVAKLRSTFWCCNLFFFILTSTASANTAEQYKNEIAHFYGVPNSQHLTLLDVRAFQQSKDYTCGPAAVMSLLYYYHKLNLAEMNDKTEAKIAKEMGTTTALGTSAQQIVNWLNQNGFNAAAYENGTLAILQQNLKKGIPVLVEWIDWGGHWDVVTGYDAEGKSPDEDKDTLFLADPSAHYDAKKNLYGITTVNPDRFATMWFDVQYINPGRMVKGIYIIAIPKT